MPLTPFVGLSAAVHILVVLVFKVVLFFVPAKKDVHYHNNRPMLSHFLSGLIVFSVFAYVTSNAYIMVRASVTNEYSSLKLVNEFVIALEADAEKSREMRLAQDQTVLLPESLTRGRPLLELEDFWIPPEQNTDIQKTALTKSRKHD